MCRFFLSFQPVTLSLRSTSLRRSETCLLLTRFVVSQARDVPRAEIAFQAMRSKGLLKGPFISDAYNGLINAYAKMGMAAKAVTAFRELLRHAERFGGRVDNSVCASLKFAILDHPGFNDEADELIKQAKKWNMLADAHGPGHRDGRDGFNLQAPRLPRAREAVVGDVSRPRPACTKLTEHCCGSKKTVGISCKYPQKGGYALHVRASFTSFQG